LEIATFYVHLDEHKKWFFNYTNNMVMTLFIMKIGTI